MQNSSENISATVIHLCCARSDAFSVPLSWWSQMFCLCLFHCAQPHLDDVCIVKPAERVTEKKRGGGSLWSRLTTWVTIFRLEWRLALLFLTVWQRHTGTDTMGLLFCLPKTRTWSSSDVVYPHTDMLQHGPEGKRNDNKSAWIQLSKLCHLTFTFKIIRAGHFYMV